MKKYIINLLLISLLWLIVATSQAQVCTTTGPGEWSTPSIWSCIGATAPPSGSFTGKIYIKHAITISADLTISGAASIYVIGSPSLTATPASIFVQGKTTFTLSNVASFIDLQPLATLGGQQANSLLQIGPNPIGLYDKLNSSSKAGQTRLTATGATLPVTLLYFNAIAEGTRVSLAWATTEELNAKHFVVERSPNLGEFTTVGTLAAAGTTQVRQNYGLIDNQPLPGTSYYRLRQEDHNGAVNFSKPVAVNVIESAPGLLVLGNPVRVGIIRLATQNLDGATYKLATLSGQLIDVRANVQQNGDVTLTPTRHLPMGLYLLTAQHGAIQLTRKLLVE